MERKDRPVTVETTRTQTFATPSKARLYAQALARHGQISKPELRSVERTTREAEKSTGKKR